MSKQQHKCGSCRFYQEARLASSGWCHHPQRKTTSDLMIMVRKNELACRDEWSHDLWEPRADAGSLAAAPPIANPFPDRKMPPATERDIAALLAAETPITGDASHDTRTAAGDDVVLSELGAAGEQLQYVQRPDPLPSWSTPESRAVQAPPAPASGPATGTRNAIIKAREAYRERSRLQAARAAEIARLAAQVDSATPDDLSTNLAPDDVSRRDRVELDLAALGLDSLPDPAGSAGHRSFLDSNPTPLAVRPSATGQDDTPASDRGRDAVPVPHLTPNTESRRHQATEPEPSSSEFDQQLSASAPTNDRSYLAGDDRLDEAHGRSRPTAAFPDGSREDPAPAAGSEYDWFTEQATTASGQSESAPAENHRPTGAIDSEFDDVEYDNIDPQTSQEPLAETELAAEETSYADESWLAVNDVADNLDQEPFPLVGHELSAHLPRICQTCRDFRPAEAGNRGWCANPWAFSHRRMVDAGDEIPCDSILGHWWLPVDEVWSEAADVSSHGQPTPLLDAWLPQRRDDVPARRRS